LNQTCRAKLRSGFAAKICGTFNLHSCHTEPGGQPGYFAISFLS
jgi:hypothetical protein